MLFRSAAPRIRQLREPPQELVEVVRPPEYAERLGDDAPRAVPAHEAGPGASKRDGEEEDAELACEYFCCVRGLLPQGFGDWRATCCGSGIQRDLSKGVVEPIVTYVDA